MAQRFQAVRISAIVLTLLVVFAAPGRANFEAGQAAWNAGDVLGAVEQWQAGAQAGEARSMLELGRLYRTGIGVLQDDVAAYMWLNLAASRGELDAVSERDELVAGMTAEARAEGQRLARDWRPVSDVATDGTGVASTTQGAEAASPEPESAAGLSPEEVILEAQDLLRTLGYEPGPSDGQWGERTAEAYRTFLRDAGLTPADVLTPEILLAMRDLAEFHGGETQEASAAQKSGATELLPPPEAILEAQSLLAVLGYRPGPADGVWGARTAEAYRAFLGDAGLPAMDALSPDGLIALRTRAGEHQTAGSSSATATQAASLAPDALHRAVQAGDIDGTEAALASGADTNTRDGGGWTPLMHAANKGYLLLVEPLLAAGADVNIRAPDGATALLMATALGHSDIVVQLMKAGADVALRGPQGKTPVDVARLVYGEPDDARESGEDPAVIALLDGRTWAGAQAWREFAALLGREPSATKVDLNGWTDLHWAAVLNMAVLAEELLVEGTVVDRHLSTDGNHFAARLASNLKKLEERIGVETEWSDWSRQGETPLHMAALSNAVETAEVLIAHGAGIGVANNHDFAAIHFSAYGDAVEMTELLLARGADIDGRSSAGNTPLHAAVWKDAAETVQLLLARGAGIDARNEDGELPLHHAAGYNAADSAGALLVHGSDPDAGDNNGDTPLHHAVRSNAEEMVELLLANDADAAARNDAGETPLHVAAFHDAEKEAELLLAHDADIDARDRRGETPLAVARTSGSDSVAALLTLTVETSEFRTLLGREPSALAADENGWTDLHWAAVLDLPETAERLLKTGAAVGRALQGDGTPLGGRLRAELDRLSRLIGYDGDGSGWTRHRQTPLHLAALLDAARTGQVLIAYGADVAVRDGRGATPLHTAAGSDAMEMVEMLLARGADFSARNGAGETPLDVARASRGESVAPLLAWTEATSGFKARLGREPSAEAADENGWTDLHWAAVLNLPEAARALLDAGAAVDPRLKNDGRSITGPTDRKLREVLGDGYVHGDWKRRHWTPLYLAARSNASETASVFLAHGADVNARDGRDFSPLRAAVVRGNTETAELLLKFGADVDERWFEGRTSLHTASQNNDVDMVNVLLAAGAEVNVNDAGDSTPLHAAVYKNAYEAAEVLVAHGADVDTRNSFDESPLKMARRLGHDRLVALMRPHSRDFIEGFTSDLNALFNNLGVDTDNAADRQTGRVER